MSFSSPTPDSVDPSWRRNGAIVVPAGEGKVVTINGDVFTIKLRSTPTGGSVGVLEINAPPGVFAAPHIHGREDESFYLISGELEFINGDKTHRLRAGDFAFVPRGTRHGYTNVGSGSAKILVFFTPGGAEEFWVEVGEDFRPESVGQPWTIDKFAALEETLKRYGITMCVTDSARFPNQ